MEKETTDSEMSGNAGAPAPVPGTSAVLPLRQDCRLVCVEYPGLVVNVDKMLETLGGEKTVSKTFADPSRRIELNYRPRDPYCHPQCANRFTTTSLLLRVWKRSRKGSGADARFEMETLGVIGTCYKFQGMSDFQYLAMHTEADGTQTSLYDKILLCKPEKKDFFYKEVPLYIPPPIFSRLDNPVDYFYRPDIQHREGYVPQTVSHDNLIGLSRARRPHNAIFVAFEEKEVPTKPLEAAVQNWRRLCVHPSDSKKEQEIKDMFERRPVWSRNAVKANLDIQPDKLKLLLPYVAYYMLTGPWRSLWVRFGYDPRKTPEAKIYQVLDFRIRCGTKHGYAVNDMPVKAKRSTLNYSLPITMNKTAPQPASIREISQEGGQPVVQKPVSPRYKLKDSAYIFREGTLPPYRQMFFQLCDLEVESIKKLIHQNDGKEEECNERDGWCIPRTSDELRDIMSALIKQTIRARRPAAVPSTSKSSAASTRGQRRQEAESGEEEEDEEGEEDEDFQPSEGSDNEMETEILDYM
ncbi:general transcription factor 3C polypeptide 5 [Anguilla anguilla]|nr:general transcription factor 3C polypeptide 5 [Anguilla anguilla]